MLPGVLGADLIQFSKVLSRPAMISYAMLFGRATYCVAM
jgi:hypothetical protein